jgi:glutamine amidotransferase
VITIVDYGVGNIGALLNMFEFLGVDAYATHDGRAIAEATKLLLPGVGAFDKAMVTLLEKNLRSPLEEAVKERHTPLLGVCLGMQLLARRSDEGQEQGLGFIEADVRRISVPEGSKLKVPHIGWSNVTATGDGILFPKSGDLERFYFVHGYHVVCDSPADVAATVDYGSTLTCAVQHDNVFGVQFHPEKSHRFGMRLLSAFANLPERTA